jgi:hypothetical protein
MRVFRGVVSVVTPVVVAACVAAGVAVGLPVGPTVKSPSDPAPVGCRYTLDWKDPAVVSLRCARGGPNQKVHAYVKCVDEIGFVHTHVGRNIDRRAGGVSTAACAPNEKGPYYGSAVFAPAWAPGFWI